GLVRDSQYLYIISRHFPEEFKAITGDQINALVKPIIAGSYNTISSAYAILALDAYVMQLNTTGITNAEVLELFAGGKQNPIAIPQTAFPKMAISNPAEKIRMKETGDKNLFYQVTEGGFDLEPPKSEM